MPVNDIAAAKRFLDRKNDAGECNSANVVLVGAEEGATLGALWLAAEWQRQRLVLDASFGGVLSSHQSGEDIVCAVWLSMRPTLGRWKVPAKRWLGPPVREAVPMVFLYGEEDLPTTRLVHSLKQDRQRADPLKLTGERGIRGTRLAGSALLLNKQLGVEDSVQSYVKTVFEDRGLRAWSQRGVDRTLLGFVPFEGLLR
jgi:hypothetical protein